MTVPRMSQSTASFGLEIRQRIRSVAESGVLLLIVFCALFAVGNWIGESVTHRREVVNATITVQPGDTVWSIARRYGDSHKYILERVHDITVVNGIEDHGALQSGQVLIVPMERAMASRLNASSPVCLRTSNRR